MARGKAATAEPESIVNETDESLVEAAQTIFAEDLVEEDIDRFMEAIQSLDPQDEATEKSEKSDKEYRPGIGDMITVRGGGLYLPVRRRVGWMRGYPEVHPTWTIDTYAEEVVRGTFKNGKVEGGYARYRANVFDESGRLISTGTKTEYSERFLDFVEKAETGAIGRALAVAGYGTEAAVDLDEGLDQERIADAPVTPSRPINIAASSIPGVRPGGRPAAIQNAQIQEIARLNKTLGLGMGLTHFMEAVKGEEMPPLEEGRENDQLLAFLHTFSHDEAGQLIQRLTKALKEKQSKDTEEDPT